MAEPKITYRFFENGDKYGQANFASLIKSVLTSGYLPQFGDKLVVSANTASPRTVSIATGMAILNGYILELENAPYNLTLDAPHETLKRIDRIVARVTTNTSTRGIAFAVLKGTPAAEPTEPALTQTSSVWELSLARVEMNPGTTMIPASAVTDERVPAYNNASALSNASKEAYGGVKIGSGINVSNGVISAGACPYPVLVRLYETDTGRAKLIDANAVQNNVKQLMDLMCRIQNQDDMRTVQYEVKFNLNPAGQGWPVSGFVRISAKNIYTDDKRVLLNTPSVSVPGAYTETGSIQLKLSETAYAEGVLTVPYGSCSITSETYTNTVYLGTPT